MVANSTTEIDVVGPETRCQDEPNSAATMAGTMAAYSPYSGGRQAMVAKATAWGSTTMAPVRPARASARSVALPTRGSQRRNGNRRAAALGAGAGVPPAGGV